MKALALLLAGCGLAAIGIACGASDDPSAAADADAGPSAAVACTTLGAVRRKENGECGAVGNYGVDPRETTCCTLCPAGEVPGNGPGCVARDFASTDGDAHLDGGGACGLALFPPDYPARCQPALDTACCNEEKACASDAPCLAVVDCLAKCTAPRMDTCVSACAPSSGLPPAFAAVATCSKNQPADPDGGAACSYP